VTSTDWVQAYTDGACKGNPGPGGWGVLLVYKGQRKKLSGGEPNTTNNRMELQAVIEALKSLKRPAYIHIHTDSQYVHKGISEWMTSWKRKGWQTAGGKPVKNQDLWQMLDELASRHHVKWEWVRGHAGHAGNEEADRLANEGVASTSL
jgi:ribonuclease HI